MRSLSMVVGIVLFFTVVLDAFQTIILPRRPSGRLRITRLFYIITWNPWSAFARRIPNDRTREQFYSIYGPLSLLLLLVVWALLLITGFAFIYFAIGTPFNDAMMGHLAGLRFRAWTDFYVSGTTLVTLGPGDVIPQTPLARAVIIFESGVGLGLVALVVGYLPVLYNAFSRREVSVAMLDARAGSPPTAAELLTRHGFDGGDQILVDLLAEWERWAAELLESHVSYPLLCYYRSQHDNQSWLSALVAILDACALLIATHVTPPQPAHAQPSDLPQSGHARGVPSRQAQLTFAIARHAIVDLGHIFNLDDTARTCIHTEPDRLPPAEFSRLCAALGPTEIRICGDADAASRLRQLRQMYEPNAQALGHYLGLSMPLWISAPRERDPWHKVAGLRSTANTIVDVRHISDLSTAAALHNKDHGH